MKKFAFLILLFPTASYAICEWTWEIPVLANASYANTALQAKGRTVATIPTSWFRQISKIKRDIDRQSGIHTKLFFCNDSEPNALATRESGQNIVMITKGMYELIGNDWDAYAALLGHENTHLIREHGSKRAWRGLGTALIKMLGSAAVISMTDDSSFGEGIGLDLVDIAGDAFYYSYSRQEEHEADLDGIIYAHKAGYNPHGAIRLHTKLNSASDFLSSHPSSADRIANINSYIANATTNNQTTQHATINENLTNRIGVVVSYNQHYKYYVASKTSLKKVIKGRKVEIEINDSNLVVGTIERVIGDYFSVLTNSYLINEDIIGKEVMLK